VSTDKHTYLYKCFQCDGTHEMKSVFSDPVLLKKEKEIEAVLADSDVDIDRLREFAISAGGLVTDKIRCRAWPKLIGIDVDNIPPKPSI